MTSTYAMQQKQDVIQREKESAQILSAVQRKVRKDNESQRMHRQQATEDIHK